MHVRYAARSDVGLGRDGNEDAGVAGPYVLAVADGMGGHAAGEVASKAAVQELARAAPSAGDPLASLAALLDAANTRIRRLAAEEPGREGMGTTATVLLTSSLERPGGQVALGHVGDSRAYLLRDGTLTQLTRDHTFVQTLVDDEQISASEARSHPARSIVTNVLQGQDLVEPDLTLVDVHLGDRMLICSDGLSDVLSDAVIEQALNSTAAIADVVDELVQRGLAGGGPDNITVVVADVAAEDTANTAAEQHSTHLVGAASSDPPGGPFHRSR